MASVSNKEEDQVKESGRLKNLYILVTDFMKKCSEDHVAAFGAMSSFFMLLSVFPFLVLLLTLTKMLPFTKEDILSIISEALSFEPTSLIVSIVNEIYRKAGSSVVTFSLVMALWSSSKGVYAIVLGLNSVYDLDEKRNYFVLRFTSALYTLVFLFVIIFMMLMWVFGKSIYHLIAQYSPIFSSVVGSLLSRRTWITPLVLTILFMCIYRFVPSRKSKFMHQLPGALVASVGWMIVSWGCSFYVEHFTNFTLIYGSMASIMLIFLWLYFCMSLIFYGAEFNYFLENKRNYHMIVRTIQPAVKALKRRREDNLRIREDEEKRRKKEQENFNKMIDELNKINEKKEREKKE